MNAQRYKKARSVFLSAMHFHTLADYQAGCFVSGAKFTYISLNIPTACPPRTDVPVNLPFLTGTGAGSYSGLEFGQVCDFPNDVWQTVSLFPFISPGEITHTYRGGNEWDGATSHAESTNADFSVTFTDYSQRTVPSYAEISGLASNNAVLSFRNENTGNHIRAGRNAEWFHAMMPLTDNSIADTTNEVRKTAVLPGQGTGGTDLINTNRSLTLSAMKTSEVCAYDNDGNLLSDGRLTYAWNGENRLVAVSCVRRDRSAN